MISSAALNPQKLPFCLEDDKATVKVPLIFNQTIPEVIELLRIDFDTNKNETIGLSRSDRKKLKAPVDQPGVLAMDYVLRKPGLYRLHRVVDELHLDIPCSLHETLVVKCPRATIKASNMDRCTGDLSDITMDLEGTPPLRVVYSRTINNKDKSFHFQRNQPDAFISPLLASGLSSALIPSAYDDVSWGRSHHVSIPLNESMTTSGQWLYSVDEIHDAAGNTFNYSLRGADGEHIYPKNSHLESKLHVHERPLASLPKCDFRSPLMIAQGSTTQLPLSFKTAGRVPDDTSHTVMYKFSPLDKLTALGDHGREVLHFEHAAKNVHHLPTIKQPGLYTLTGVRSKHCEGEIREPSSCLLLNPPIPRLAVQVENIHDKCAGNPIGLLVDFDLVGTPPFVLKYTVINGGGTRTETRKIDGFKSQLELKPSEAGSHKYKFISIADAVYNEQKLDGKEMQLEQNVKPPASASFAGIAMVGSACIEEPLDFEVEMHGERPFNLEYELIHNGKKKRDRISDIETNMVAIKTQPLQSGGKYSLVLTSVQDRGGCKISLNEGRNFTVRHQRPRGSFGQIEGRFKSLAIEGDDVSLPIRLTGQGPWSVKYRNKNEAENIIHERQARLPNDAIPVSRRGVYELVEVRDQQCPGTIEADAASFEIDWVAKPQLSLAHHALMERSNDRFIKPEVCEGDVDSFDIKLTGMLLSSPCSDGYVLIDLGSPPYHVKYTTRHKPLVGAVILRNKEFDAGLEFNTIAMDTSKAGQLEYVFTELSDNQYYRNPTLANPLILEQRVNPKPTAKFSSPGKSYSYCKVEVTGEEIIPMQLTGTPPFYLEVDLRHRSRSKVETMSFPNIATNQYKLRLPKQALGLGVHQVSIRKIRDAHGCQEKLDHKAPTVQVQVFDEPSIAPLETRQHYCVGERISYTLSGQPPFEVHYSFERRHNVAKVATNTFKRIAEKPGNFTITAISDKASDCRSKTEITRIIHEMPSVKISKGRQTKVDIHEGHKAEILFEFWGTPPFEFTYTRSTNVKKGQRAEVLETRHEVSHEYSMIIPSSLEGTYEVVAIKDNFCSFSSQPVEHKQSYKLLQN